MTADFVLRPARPREADVMTELAMRSKAHWGYSAAFMAACREELSVSPEQIASGAIDYVVAVKGPQMVGFYGLERLPGAEFELEALFVEPADMGTGVGRSLIQHAVRAVAAGGGCTLVIQGDPNAERFYRAAGGQLIGTRESSSIPGRFLPVFAISIAPATAEQSE